jgi:ATP-dependent DNA helicase RecQ
MENEELSPEVRDRLDEVRTLMGYEKLYPEQLESILANLRGEPTLTLLTTGGGKSACYIIPGIVLNRITVVVSPLIALQNDQVRSLERLNISAYLYNSEVQPEEKEAISAFVHECKEEGYPAFLFVSPESLITDAFCELFPPGLIDFMAIDEAHCVSTWGNSFRPDYQRLKKAAVRLRIPQSGGYTATCTKDILEDIFRYTPLNQKTCRVIAGKNIRPNLKVSVIHEEFTGKPKERADKKKYRFLELTKKARGAVIVYLGSRYSCETLYLHGPLRALLRKQGYQTYMYHAGVADSEKRRVEKAFAQGKRPLVFATNAFGMGIDRADVGLVVHYTNPMNLLGYAQEIGRAGRDGKDADCVTFFDESKIDRSVAFREHSLPTIDFVEGVYYRLAKVFLKRKASGSLAEFSSSKYLRMLEHTVRANESFEGPDAFLNRTRESIALLKRAGYIIEDEDAPFRMLSMTPGNDRHQRIVKFTKMNERNEAVQAAAVVKFFTAENPTQELLWELLE